MAEGVSARLFDQQSVPWYVVVSTTGVLTAQSARPTGDVFFEGQAMYWFIVTSPNGTTWHVMPSHLGGFLTTPTQPQVGPGSANVIPIRDANGGLWYFLVSNTGVLSVTLDADAFVAPSLVEQEAFYCWRHGLVYRPDTRIYPLATTHCPMDNSPLVSWREFIGGWVGERGEAAEFLDEWLYT
jgi:hypothetical protein